MVHGVSGFRSELDSVRSNGLRGLWFENANFRWSAYFSLHVCPPRRSSLMSRMDLGTRRRKQTAPSSRQALAATQTSLPGLAWDAGSRVSQAGNRDVSFTMLLAPPSRLQTDTILKRRAGFQAVNSNKTFATIASKPNSYSLGLEGHCGVGSVSLDRDRLKRPPNIIRQVTTTGIGAQLVSYLTTA